MVAESVRSLPTQRYFTHVPRTQPPEKMTRATRYLCAAVYLNDTFRKIAISELLERPHGAVVPSYGMDIGPVLAHSLRAGRMMLTRDVTICAAIFVLFWISPGGAVAYFCASGALAIAALFDWQPIPLLACLAGGGVSALVVLYGLGRLFGLPFVGMPDLGGTGVPADPGAGGHGLIVNWWTDPLAVVAMWALLWIVVSALIFSYRLRVYRVMRAELRPGAASTEPPAAAHAGIGRLTDAQRGNITLYSGKNPFIGSGTPDSPWGRVWSIALELDRPAPGGAAPERVDPVRLHEHIRRALMAMSEEWPLTEDDEPDSSDPAGRLAANQRVAGMSVDYQVIAHGLCEQYSRPADSGFDPPAYAGHPLIDAGRGVPYSRATDEARDAIIRHPQAGIRCYQRVTVGAEGQAVRDDLDQIIAPAEDQDILVSAFVYLAVEGHMLYAQFVADVLPPIRRTYRMVDELATYDDRALRRLALFNHVGAMLGAGFRAPFSVVRGIVAALGDDGRKPPSPAGFMAYDYGARVSLRELAAEPALTTFTQTLDAHKYLQLIERRLNEAVLDHLQRHHIDVSSYRQQMAAIINNGVLVSGDITGSQLAVGVSGGQVNLSATSA